MSPEEAAAKVNRALLLSLVAIVTAGNDSALTRLQEVADRELVRIRPSCPALQKRAAILRRELADAIFAARKVGR